MKKTTTNKKTKKQKNKEKTKLFDQWRLCARTTQKNIGRAKKRLDNTNLKINKHIKVVKFGHIFDCSFHAFSGDPKTK